MGNEIIAVEGLGKRYRLGEREPYKMLRDVLTNVGARPFRALLRRPAGPPHEPKKARREYLWALRDATFDVHQGEIVGVVGKNGSGKSTLLKILARITEPTEGRATIRGRVGSLLEVGTGFHPELTGRENVFLNGAILGMKRKEIVDRFDEIAAFSGVERFLDTPVKRYSSGMYVRLAFAVAAHLEPEVLLVDEVLSVGDAEFQKKCLGLMTTASEMGRTILFVSHNAGAVKTLCSRAILLENGEIEAIGAVADILDRYLGPMQQAESAAAAAPAAARTWAGHARPGNDAFRVNAVTLRDSEGQLAYAVPLSKPATVEIEYESLEDEATAQFSVVLFDSAGHCAFSCLSNTEPLFYKKPLRRGRYVSECEIYGDLLNVDNYSVTIIAGCADWRQSFRLERVIEFRAKEDDVLRGDYRGNYSGCVRPRLRWRTRRLDEVTEEAL